MHRGGITKAGSGLARRCLVEAPAPISAVLCETNICDLQGLLDKLRQGGLGNQAKSWLGNGANMPVSADQLRAALGDEDVKQLAGQFGVAVDKVLQLLSEHLPETVDQASKANWHMSLRTMTPRARRRLLLGADLHWMAGQAPRKPLFII